MHRSPFKCPVVCTAGYPTYPSGKAHSGEDYVPADKSIEANWDLFSVGSGKVYISKKQRGTYPNGYGAYGNYIVYQLDDGYWVLCAHLANLPLVKTGGRVSEGQKIGVVGATGNVTGRHLHIEVADMRGVAYNGSTWYSEFCAHRVKPSDYINFKDYEKQEDFPVKEWKNGRTRELVFQTTTDCKKQSNSIGSLNPREVCDCYGIIDGCYLVSYTIDGTNSKKCGFVKYSGGVKV